MAVGAEIATANPLSPSPSESVVDSSGGCSAFLIRQFSPPRGTLDVSRT
jgi:hypothetical protein